jgi:hypothetical protein
MMPEPKRAVSPQLQEEVRSRLAAREELGPGHDDQLAAALAREMHTLVVEEINRQVSGRSPDTLKLLNWRKEILAISMGIGLPMILVAGLTAGLLGVIVVCAMIVLVDLGTLVGGDLVAKK